MFHWKNKRDFENIQEQLIEVTQHKKIIWFCVMTDWELQKSGRFYCSHLMNMDAACSKSIYNKSSTALSKSDESSSIADLAARCCTSRFFLLSSFEWRYLWGYLLVVCIVLLRFIFTVSMYMLRTFSPMFHCICMYVDVWFASVRPK